jgi:PAS domain-containing protein
MDSEGRVADWNEAAAQTFGWSRNQALGAVLSELIIPVQFRANHKQGLGPIDIHCIQIMAAARMMNPVKWLARLS